MAGTDRSGTDLGRYRLVRLLGRGGMGEVYEAIDTAKDRTVALKLLPAALAHDDFRTRFLRESQTVARLNDPHIIPIHDFGELDGQLFLDMRIVHGRDLRSIVKAGPLPPARAVAIVEQIAGALDTAHASGLLHRDVKPENVLIDDRDFAYLADFGLAQSAGQTRLTSTGMAIGSFAYMAPERFGTDVPVGPPSDVYALACVLYECLVGAPPFAAGSIEQIIAGHLSRPAPTTGTAFDGVLATGMAKDPAARFASAGALAAAARAALADGAAHHATMVAPAPPTVHPTYPPQPVSAEPVKKRSTVPLIVAAVVAVIALAAGGITLGLMRDSGEPEVTAVSSPTTPAPVTVTETHSAPPPESTESASETVTSTPTASARGVGDLGLSIPISTPACDGSTIAIVYSATNPGGYVSEIESTLARHPGAQYLRTDQSCASLRQSLNGNPIYAVYYPGASLAESCAVKARTGSRVNVRRLDDSTPVNTELC